MISNLYSVFYISAASADLQVHDLDILQRECVVRNQAKGITGLLLHGGGLFMQVIEGDEQTVKTLFQKIERDTRHHTVINLISDPINERLFPHWSMAFRDLDDIACDRLAAELGWHQWPETIAGATARARPEVIVAAMQKGLTAARTPV